MVGQRHCLVHSQAMEQAQVQEQGQGLVQAGAVEEQAQAQRKHLE